MTVVSDQQQNSSGDKTSGGGMRHEERVVRDQLAKAGIEIGGSQPWDLTVNDDRFFGRVIANGSLALGESYMDGDWDCQELDQFFHKVLVAELDEKPPLSLQLILTWLRAKLLNRQNQKGVWVAADVHYDLGVDIFEATFDNRLTGSCAYWPNAKNLDEAQEHKLDLICRKIGLEQGQTVYDIGCGWGAFLGFATERYGANGVGVTISKEQAAYARNRYAGQPLQIEVMDYRDHRGTADHVVSMGMFEHVGAKNYRAYFEHARSVISEQGLFLLHTITNWRRFATIDPWIDKYIFPNGELPTVGQVGRAVEGLFVVEDVHNFGVDYDRTLMAWYEKFQGNRKAIADKYGERFCRMWDYYLTCCAAGFRSRRISVSQFVLSPKGVPGGYQTVR